MDPYLDPHDSFGAVRTRSISKTGEPYDAVGVHWGCLYQLPSRKTTGSVHCGAGGGAGGHAKPGPRGSRYFTFLEFAMFYYYCDCNCLLVYLLNCICVCIVAGVITSIMSILVDITIKVKDLINIMNVINEVVFDIILFILS